MSKKNNKIRCVGVIPARYKSSRFPGKPLADIFGKPMIYWVCRQVKKAKRLDDYMVATDDDRILCVCRQLHLPVILTSDKHVNGTERVAEVARRIKGDIFVDIQGDEPMISPAAIDGVVDAFLDDSSIEYAQAAKRIVDPADFVDNTVVKIAVSRNNWAVYLSRSPIPYPRSTLHFKAYKHIGVYGFRRKFLLDFVRLGESDLEAVEGIEQLRAIENGKQLKIIETKQECISVDTPNDLQRIIKQHRYFFT